ncbi:MAG: lysylphosphatidylglycerol synthase transmembrane domain-containing protein [Rhodospirillaceae bacterium]|nr:lysylphosphatidylglycerol synthase transmembrane domain-containing protein [Rhodospirillaceae bacterium]
MHRFLLLAGKLIVSSALLYIALLAVDLDALWVRLGKIDPLLAAYAVAVLILQVLIAAWRWLVILRAMSLSAPASRIIRISFIGTFFNQTLPSTIGGDTIRVWLGGRVTGSWQRTLNTVLIDRLMGLIGLISIGLAAVLFFRHAVSGLEAIRIVIWVIAGTTLVLAASFILGRLVGSRLPDWSVARALDTLCDDARSLVVSPTGLIVWAQSVAIQGATVVAAWLLSKSVGAAVSLSALFALVPVVVLVSMAPVSVAGWGLREGAMVAAFALAGLNSSDAFAISILLGLVLLVVGAIGGLAWVIGGKPHPFSLPPEKDE